MPKKINNKSENEHIKQTTKINSFFKPCSITKIFCGPKAKIKLNPVIKPSSIKLIFYFVKNFKIVWLNLLTFSK